MCSLIAFLPLFMGGSNGVIEEYKGLAAMALTLIIVVFGFFHFFVFQCVCILIWQFFNPSKQGVVLEVWGTCMYFGDIIGFFMSNFLTDSLQMRWEATFIVFAILNCGIALLMDTFIN